MVTQGIAERFAIASAASHAGATAEETASTTCRGSTRTRTYFDVSLSEWRAAPLTDGIPQKVSFDSANACRGAREKFVREKGAPFERSRVLTQARSRAFSRVSLESVRAVASNDRRLIE